jgi:hypothetical protein
MQFQLPSNLQTELLAYDPKLKALARQQKQANPSKKAKYPLGNIPHLIPYSVVRESLQQPAIDSINASLAADRHHSFTTPVDVATSQARMMTKAILYHFEQCWYAAWLPPKGEEDQYVYGYAYAFRDTAGTRKVIQRDILSNIEKYDRIEVGRSVFYVYRKHVTRQDIANGNNDTNWRARYLASYSEKGRHIAKAADEFRKSLEETIPMWEDSRNLFARLQCNNIAKALEFPSTFVSAEQQSTWELTVDNVLNLVPNSTSSYSNWRAILDTKHILNTPFFRKWIQQKVDESINAYNDLDNRLQRNIKAPFAQIIRLAENISYVDKIWPDCPIDHYQNHANELLGTYIRLYTVSAPVTYWLRKHMPVASFFGLLAKHYTGEAERLRTNGCNVTKDYDLSINIYRFYEWNDTMSMLNRVLEDKEDLAPPKRWRIADFHDYVQAESWKVQNANEKLPQDLFPEPLRVQINSESWSFFQPNDTHQLAMWGQAVRNCVGSASGYAEGVRKKKHFIVLCMIEGKPQFTIQLKVEGGMMSVDQIKGLSNQNLTIDQRDQYTEAFQQALQLRNQQLSS